MFSRNLYVRVRPNVMRVRDVDSGREIEARSVTPFTSQRLLVGQFRAADDTLKRALSELGVGSFLKSRRLVMHPLEMVDGGVSEVEERVLLELAGSDARKAIVWVGRELTDLEVREKLQL